MSTLYAPFNPNELPFIDPEPQIQPIHDFNIGNVVGVESRSSRHRLIVHKEQCFHVTALIGTDQLHVKCLLKKKEWSGYNYEFTAHFSHFVKYAGR